MRIISKFKDYYDGAAFGMQDESLIWCRDSINKTVKMSNEQRYQKHICPVDTSYLVSDACNSKWLYETQSKYEEAFAHVHFCGKVYTVFYSIIVDFNGRTYRPIGCVNSYEKFEQLLLKHPERFIQPHQLDKKKYYYNGTPSTRLKKFFSGNGKPSTVNEEFNSPVVIETVEDGNVEYYIDCKLGDIGFASIFNPNEAWQEISMWMGNFYHRAENELVTVDNDTRVMQHGFDEFSFRKSPTKRISK